MKMEFVMSEARSQEMGRLLVTSPPEAAGYIFLEKSEMLMGREIGCDIQISDQQSSKHHAKIYKERNYYIIQDLASSNGTFVNDRKIKKQRLEVGDVIRIGNFQYKF